MIDFFLVNVFIQDLGCVLINIFKKIQNIIEVKYIINMKIGSNKYLMMLYSFVVLYMQIIIVVVVMRFVDIGIDGKL